MAKLAESLLLVAAGAAIGAVGYMALKHPEELKEMVDGAVALGEKVLGGEPEAASAEGPVVHSEDVGEKNE